MLNNVWTALSTPNEELINLSSVFILPFIELPLIMYMFMVGKNLKKDVDAYNAALENMTKEAVEYVRGIPVVKTFGQSVFSFKKFKKSIDDYEKL